MKRSGAALLGMILSVVLGMTLALVAAPASAASPYCGIRWGSLPKSVAAMSTAPVVDVRSGRHGCYDRLVLDVAGTVQGYSVRYVPTLEQVGSGSPVAARGGAKLAVTAHVPSYDLHHQATFDPADHGEVVDVTGYRTFRQVVWLGSFEGYTALGLGVRARLPFRVFVLDGPGAGSRLVVDVAHRW